MSAQIFKRTVQQYDQFRKRNAFLEQYKKEPMFENGLEEFDDARAVAADLIEEYQACEKPNYIVSGRVVRALTCAPGSPHAPLSQS